MLELDRRGHPIEFGLCDRCRGETPLSVNTVDQDGTICILCRAAASPPACTQPSWTIQELLGGM